MSDQQQLGGSSSDMQHQQLDLSVTEAASVELNHNFDGKGGMFVTPTSVGEPVVENYLARFNTDTMAKTFLFATPPTPLQHSFVAAADPISEQLSNNNFLRFNSNGLQQPIRQMEGHESSEEEHQSGNLSESDVSSRTSRSHSYASADSGAADMPRRLLEKMEKIQSMATGVIKDLKEYISMSEIAMRERASAMYSTEPAESYTARLEFVVGPSDIEYCNKGIDPALEVRLVDLDGNPITDRSVPLQIIICDGESRPLDKTTTGGPLVTGTSEAMLVRGVATFNNLRIMEVSSKHMNKCFHIVVECKTRQGIQPVVSNAVRVYAKKINTPKQKRSDVYESDKRQKY